MTDDVRCDTREASCICDRELDHDGPHKCLRDDCGGEWTFDDKGRFVVVTLPGGEAWA